MSDTILSTISTAVAKFGFTAENGGGTIIVWDAVNGWHDGQRVAVSLVSEAVQACPRGSVCGMTLPDALRPAAADPVLPVLEREALNRLALAALADPGPLVRECGMDALNTLAAYDRMRLRGCSLTMAANFVDSLREMLAMLADMVSPALVAK